MGKINYHKALANYFTDKCLYLDDYIQKQPNVRKLVEQPWQQIQGEKWEALEKTLTDLSFIEAKCKAKKVYDLVSDYINAEEVWPNQDEKRLKDKDRHNRIHKYALSLVSHRSAAPGTPIPQPPQSLVIDKSRSSYPQENGLSPLNHLQEWGNFVRGNVSYLALDQQPAFQLAYNWMDGGSVAQFIEKAVNRTGGYSGKWLRLLNRPAYTPDPLCNKVLLGHRGHVCNIAMTLDGLRALSGGEDGTLRLWHLETGECLQIINVETRGVQYGIDGVAISVDGMVAVAGTYDIITDPNNPSEQLILEVWDLISQRKISCYKGPQHRGLPIPTLDRLVSASVTADGARVMLFGYLKQKTLIFGNILNGCFDEVKVADLENINDATMTPDGSYVLTAHEDGTIRVWDANCQNCLKVIKDHGNLDCIRITPDCKWLVSTTRSTDKTIRIWDLNTGFCKVLKGHTERISSIDLNPDGKIIVSGSYDGTVRVWDRETGGCLKVLEGHNSRVICVSIDAEGRRVLSGSQDGIIRLWNVESSGYRSSLKRHNASVSSVSISFNGGKALSNTKTELFLWDLTTGGSVKTLECCEPSKARILISSEFRDPVLIGNGDVLEIKRIENDTLIGSVKNGWEGTTSILSSAHAKRLISLVHPVRIWNSQTWECIRVIELTGYDSGAISQDGKYAIFHTITAKKSTIQLWDLEKCQIIKAMERSIENDEYRFDSNIPEYQLMGVLKLTSLMSNLTEQIKNVGILLLSGARLAIEIGRNGGLYVWDIKNHTLKARIMKEGGLAGSIRAVTITPNDRYVVTGDYKGLLELWDIKSYKCIRTFHGHSGNVRAIAISGDGKLVISGGDDSTIRIWDIESGYCTAMYNCEGGNITCLALHESKIIAGTNHGLIFILNLENFSEDLPLVTATRFWHNDTRRLFNLYRIPGHWDKNLSISCYWCGHNFDVSESDLGEVVACKFKNCRKAVLLNQSVCDNIDL